MNAIVAEVMRRGRVSFAEFMALALYHPSAGYYTKERSGAGPAGPEGDFITAPTATPLFAQTLAQLLGSLASDAGEPITLLELGAGEGFFLVRLAEALGGDRDQVIGRAVAVERSAWARKRLARRCPWVECAAALAELPRAEGPAVLIASELYDAFPAHRVVMVRRGGELTLTEFFVIADEHGGLHWVLDTPSGEELASYLAEHGVALEEGQVAELRPEVPLRHREHLAWCGKDAVALLLDYGHHARALFNPRGRRFGSLVAYRGHTIVEDVLQDPGELDLTAHINFDDLMSSAAEAGWDRGELRALGSFLALHGALELLPAMPSVGEPLAAREWADLAAAKKLLMPVGMGGDLKVLAQGCGALWQAYQRLAAPPPLEA